MDAKLDRGEETGSVVVTVPPEAWCPAHLTWAQATPDFMRGGVIVRALITEDPVYRAAAGLTLVDEDAPTAPLWLKDAMQRAMDALGCPACYVGPTALAEYERIADQEREAAAHAQG